MEHTAEITLITAFLAGIISFLSPCVLPLIPGYISFISGSSLKEMMERENLKKIKHDVIWNSFAFVIGFSVIFISLGASATFIGKFLLQHLNTFSLIAGIIVIILGLHMTGIFKIKALYHEKRIHQSKEPMNLFESFLLGLAFAFGWTPCIGPILAGILAIAATGDSVGYGILLLALYSLGLGIPFMLTAYSITFFFKWFTKMKKHMNKIEIMAGILLILIGILMMTGGLTRIAGMLSFLDVFAK
ncbi:MAG: cytochrome C biogenesis protein [Candidatus Goldiibacteriota bacterium HGW-Goldbacteria-1]|jgi:cytochrome c-type biogenesis protein|nr:MAG: cytochrome C biogenesis protein [Candidatus Goldiibacteriota bacterium HGW-Goldbacteria-1]